MWYMITMMTTSWNSSPLFRFAALNGLYRPIRIMVATPVIVRVKYCTIRVDGKNTILIGSISLL